MSACEIRRAIECQQKARTERLMSIAAEDAGDLHMCRWFARQSMYQAKAAMGYRGITAADQTSEAA